MWPGEILARSATRRRCQRLYERMRERVARLPGVAGTQSLDRITVWKRVDVPRGRSGPGLAAVHADRRSVRRWGYVRLLQDDGPPLSSGPCFFTDADNAVGSASWSSSDDGAPRLAGQDPIGNAEIGGSSTCSEVVVSWRECAPIQGHRRAGHCSTSFHWRNSVGRSRRSGSNGRRGRRNARGSAEKCRPRPASFPT